jgi:hypothetical protein
MKYPGKGETEMGKGREFGHPLLTWKKARQAKKAYPNRRKKE